MNPTVATQPRPAALPDAAPTASSATALTTNIVDNIPMHAPTQPAPAAPNEDTELDTIMQNISHELKQADRQTTKKHFALLGRKPKPEPRPAAMPKIVDVSATKPVPVPQPAPAAPRPNASATTAPRPSKTGSAPVGIIFITVLVTGVLIAAAIYSYR